MDDYRQPDTPETANEVEMLLDQQLLLLDIQAVLTKGGVANE